MGMFDWYEPSGPLSCPFDGHPLKEWQGKDGPRALFIWKEGIKRPADHWVDDEVRLSAAELEAYVLPPTFTIYSYDCPVHQPIIATCTTENGIWRSTEIPLPVELGTASSTGESQVVRPHEFILVDLTTQMPFLPSYVREWPRERLLAWLRVWGEVHRTGQDTYTFQSWSGRWTQFLLRPDGRMFLAATRR